jgi:hypothetical protein
MQMHKETLPIVIATVIVASVGARTVTHRSQPTAESAVVRLHDGSNFIDLLGTGESAFVSVADRENFNAHGHHIAVFEVRARIYPGDAGSAMQWQVVPFFGGPGDFASGNEVFGTTEGADCTLRDLRIIREPRRPVTVVIAQREFGRSYADSAPISFHYFDLRVNSQGQIGYPSYYFVETHVVQSKRAYCDVDDAFDRELGLGPAGVVAWNGPR